MFGPAPVLDFDGTLAYLPVDWAKLRQRLHVERIEEIWATHGDWSVVAAEEIDAAAVAAPVSAVLEHLQFAHRFAVLTSNDARAVHRFIDRFPLLKDKLAVVVGRIELGGPKTEFERFALGVQRCLESIAPFGVDDSVYVGDSQYELDFAGRMGLRVVDVRDVSEA